MPLRLNLTTFAAIPIIALLLQPANAQQYTSAYSDLNYDKHCEALEEFELGVNAKCTGYQGYPVYFSEGDLRIMVRFGHTPPKTNRWQSFGEFNYIGDKVEWRLSGGKPFATILRWYIEATNDTTGENEKGQVLVISTVATTAQPANACVVGYVDARANANANQLARTIADTVAIKFRCGEEQPQFHGARGKYSGNPTTFLE